MAQIKVYYDQEGNTLTVWFGNPEDEYVAEETGLPNHTVSVLPS